MRILLILIALVTLTDLAAAQTPPQAGTVTGYVWTAQNAAIADATLLLRHVVSGAIVQRTITNETGAFTFTAVPTGQYIVEFIRAGEPPVTMAVGHPFSLAAGETVATFVRIAAQPILTPEQSPNKMGLTLSSGAIGIHVPVGDRAAVRPTFGFSRTTSTYDGAQFIQAAITTTTLVPGASVLFYLKSWDATRLYVSPQYSYSRLSVDGNEPRAAHSGAFMVGAQHGLGSRFGLFAEGGLDWSRTKSTSPFTLLPASVTTTTWGTRATVGGILFF